MSKDSVNPLKDKSLLPNSKGIEFFSYFMALRHQNREYLAPHLIGEKLFRILSISKKFFNHGIIRNSSVLHFGLFSLESERIEFAADVYLQKGKHVHFVLFTFQKEPQLSRFIKIARFFGIESNGIPISRFSVAFQRTIETGLDPAYFRFHHYIKKNDLICDIPLTQHRVTRVPVFPDIYERRDLRAPHFYAHVKEHFPETDGETYIYLPQLFLKPRLPECCNASYKILICDSDDCDPSKMRTLYSFKKNQATEANVRDAFGTMHFYDLDKCEGLTFSSNPNFIDPKTQQKHEYAFKLSDPKVRILIMVECDDADGTHLVDRCVQTARLYASMLAEMPDLKRFDIALMIVMNPLNNFPKTIASNMLSKARGVSNYPVETIRRRRFDLRWFLDLCSLHAVCQPHPFDAHPLLRCLWIVDAIPRVYEA